MRAHQRLRQIGIAPQQRLIDLDVLGIRFSAAIDVAEIDRQAALAHRVIDRTDPEEDRVLRGPHDLQVKIAVLLGQQLAPRDPRPGPVQNLAQRRKVFLCRALAGQFRRLDLVDLAQFHRLVDLDRVQRQPRLGKERQRLDRRRPRGQEDARFRPPLHDPHRFQNGQRLADLAPAHSEMLGQFPLGRGPAAGQVRRGVKIGCKIGKQVLVGHRS